MVNWYQLMNLALEPAAMRLRPAVLAGALVALASTAAAMAPHFHDVRDRLGCQRPGHTQYPFCNTSLSYDQRVVGHARLLAALRHVP